MLKISVSALAMSGHGHALAMCGQGHVLSDTECKKFEIATTL